MSGRTNIVIAIGSSFSSSLRLSDLERIHEKIKDITNATLQAVEMSKDEYSLTVSPFGPIILLRQDHAKHAKATLRVLAGLAEDKELEVKAAVTWGNVRVVEREEFSFEDFVPSHHEGQAIIDGVRILAAAPPCSLSIDDSIVELWGPVGKDSERLNVEGKHPNENYEITLYPSFFTPKPQSPFSPFQTKAIIHPGDKGAAQRFNRRRWRIAPTSLNQVIVDLAAFKNTTPENQILAKIRNLDHDWEKVLGRAFYCEWTGEIEQLVSELSTYQFEGNKECYRRLLLALGQEKLDNIDEAKKHLEYVLSQATADQRLLAAAQFNLAIVNEKLGAFDSINSSRFLKDTETICDDGQKLWHKAVSLDIVACLRSGKKCFNSDLVEKALLEEKDHSPKGWMKNLLNWHEYLREPLSDSDTERILSFVPSLTGNARTGVPAHLLRLQNDEQKRSKIIELLNQVMEKSYAIDKWYDGKAHD